MIFIDYLTQVEFGEQFFDVYEKVEQVDKMLVARKK